MFEENETVESVEEHQYVLPNSSDIDALIKLQENLANEDFYGAKTFVKRIGLYLKRHDLACRAWKALEVSCNTSNGVHGARQPGIATVAKRYFSELTNTQLKQHCGFWGIDAGEYIWPDDRDIVISDLVKAQVESASQEVSRR